MNKMIQGCRALKSNRILTFQVEHGSSWQVSIRVEDQLSFSCDSGILDTKGLLEEFGVLVVWQVDDLQWDGLGDLLQEFTSTVDGRKDL